ncbi:hypothetical protein CDN99_15725 [Roseateles aquatilis]|jgi:predicted RNA-binding protein YlqC (UPF0109 family)|uniref:Uncharacterized protein n=1 Tax=Roseateles aquatilis TaxID=431061 RepID=A0A246J8F5_9BURK|nr:hypothetical protein [Roseateles aquatilis]MBY0365369.1 hypothetical protein [Burkholderiaceae bacterium]OWQ88917.1 hypothetical protein CDN99_15725 [Roseateles aquatilis]
MPAVAESPLLPLVGSPEEVRTRLGRSKARRVIVLPVADEDAGRAGQMAQTLSSVIALIGAAWEAHDEQLLRTVVNAVVPKAPPSPNLIKEAAMTANARKAVLQGADWLTAAQLAEVAGLSASNPSTQPNKWKRLKQIFAIDLNGVDYFPGYGLDPETGYRPRKSLTQVLKVFGDDKDGWGLAYWFLGANSFLGGRRPQDVLLTDPSAVVAAAQDEMSAVEHA